MDSCFLFGHRDAPEELAPAMTAAIQRHICDYGVNEFYVGGYGSFDLLASRVLAVLKKQYPQIRLYRLLPYHPQLRPIQLPQAFDDTFYPEGMESVPKPYAIVRANRYMIEKAEFLIAYAWQPASNARKLLEYAKRKQKLITEIRIENKAFYVHFPENVV